MDKCDKCGEPLEGGCTWDLCAWITDPSCWEVPTAFHIRENRRLINELRDEQCSRRIADLAGLILHREHAIDELKEAVGRMQERLDGMTKDISAIDSVLGD